MLLNCDKCLKVVWASLLDLVIIAYTVKTQKFKLQVFEIPANSKKLWDTCIQRMGPIYELF